MTQKSLNLTSGQLASHARTSALREWGQGLGFEGPNLDSFTTLCGSFERVSQGQLSSKTSTAFLVPTEEETSQSFSRRWTSAGMTSRGVCLTLNISESPNNVVESTLLGSIEAGEVPEKYFLSQNAATGILRRVDRMGRNLPPSFRQSLEILSGDPS